MDDFGNGFDSFAVQSNIEDLQGGIERYWLFVLSGYDELDSKQNFYYGLLISGNSIY